MKLFFKIHKILIRRRNWVAIVVATIFLAGCGGRNPAPRAEKVVRIGTQEFRVEIADDSRSRATGFQNRAKPADNFGILFEFEEEKPRNFWMKNVDFPLDAIFISAEGRVVDILKMVPCEVDPCQIFSSKLPAKFVVELASGIFLGERGDFVEFLERRQRFDAKN